MITARGRSEDLTDMSSIFLNIYSFTQEHISPPWTVPRKDVFLQVSCEQEIMV